MKSQYESKKNQAWDDPYKRMVFFIRKNPWTWQSIGVVSGLAGGILSLVFGTLLTVVKWFTTLQWASPYLNRLSLVLFLLTIPLLALGAHCLDLLEAKTSPLSPSTEQQSAATAKAA